jgi:anti-anti-sigma factor
MSDGRARYACENGIWFLNLSGELRHTLSPAVNALLDRAFAAHDTAQFLVDLSDAESIDSTCLGTLARIANWAGDHAAPQPVIVTPNEDITETLRAVCFDRLFDLRGSRPDDAGRLTDVPARDVDAGELSDLILDVHRRLCAIDARNATAFKDVVQALENERAPGKPDGA